MTYLRPTPEAFEEIIQCIGIGEFYGAYHGRFFHEGYAVELDSAAELFVLGVKLARYKDELGRICDVGPHQDQLGLGIIASWPKSLFNTEGEA